MTNPKLILPLVLLAVSQLLFLIFPIGTDGIHGQAFLQNSCEIQPKNLDFARISSFIGIGLTIVLFFKVKNRGLFVITLLLIIISQIVVISEILAYMRHHHNPCHEIASTFGTASCDGFIDYSGTVFLPALSLLIAIITAFVGFRVLKNAT